MPPIINKPKESFQDLAQRFPENPLLLPRDLQPSAAGLHIISLLNPGAFRYEGKTCLLVRVAEGVTQKEGVLFFPALNATGNAEIIEVPLNDPDLIATDARVINYKGLDYLTTISHLRLLASEDGVYFEEQENYPALFGNGYLERFGVEDCRVSQIDDTYYLTYTAVSDSGVGVGMKTTRDWQHFESYGMILPPHNKDCAIFEEKVGGKYYCLHRPSSKEIGGNYIWLAESPDGLHWGNHQCLIKTRPGLWDSARVGAGAAPIRTERGWLEIYHGANAEHQYCLGAFLMDIDDPSKVISRTTQPIMVPAEAYELSGFFGYVVFTNGHVVDGDRLTVYYGAADEFVCGAYFSISEILTKLL
ncbi:glycoside hydrolase family 130 protein [Mucilaginibacter aquaedulcis]|uniref:glycoside hydrolase family 130 protein n=1 Tax=Mucilaginibacter aquaedulcis TaxID=1187081 RepID=UPI0025B5BE24|nr:glycoside hydrolase family 130 protein [Mucilaginibacter aquaedulcis]MDN3551170.1 glycoside hydrolase family 130 protein [Mucilaginibacter aquaedulcis]